MSEKLNQLKEILAEVADLRNTAAVLGWDQQTFMPQGGSEARGYQLATLGKLAQIKFTSDEVGKLLDDLKAEYAGADPESDDAAYVRVAARDYEKAVRVPPEFVAEQAVVTTRAFEAWVEARQKSDFSVFRPHLEKVVDLVKKYVSFFPPADHPYDTLLDDYEPGMKTAEVKAIFDALRPKQVKLLKAIADKKQVKDSFLYGKYNDQKMEKFSREIATQFGYDWSKGRQDRAPHPFTTTFSVNDVRITTRFEADKPIAMLFSTMHETGHALYELGSKQEFDRTPLMGGASLAIHESQSRMWENLVGRSMAFWEYFYPKLQKTFSSQLGEVSLKSFYKAINKVEPSFIRVNADEATYNMHIMLRLELEIGMVEGALDVKDLPDIWNTKMDEYLGITPANDAQGVLQDMHWSGGAIGYFSTYALGNLVSAQLWEKITKDIPDLDQQFRKGKFDGLLGWLRENLHVHGRKFEPQELVKKITGSRINSDAYVRYLTKKFGEVYGL
ncbi:MAG TPA: carboxypeptidase M32 [Anaerolineales bacterium]|nr:carboxypeptidase M32 [Anaerolineales bacterium]